MIKREKLYEILENFLEYVEDKETSFCVEDLINKYVDKIMYEYGDLKTTRENNYPKDFDDKEYERIIRMNKDRLHMMSENDIKLMCDVIGILSEPKHYHKYYGQMFRTRLSEIELEQKQVEICKDYNKHNCDNDIMLTLCQSCNKEIQITTKWYKEQSQEQGKVECHECRHNTLNDKKNDNRIITFKCDKCSRLIDTTLHSLKNMCKNNNNQLLCIYCRGLL